MKAYISTHATRADGSRDSFATVICEAKRAPTWWQLQGLQFTATGYGARIPTEYMVLLNGKWRRVHCRIYSNAGTCFIGRNINGGFVVAHIEGA